MKKYVWLAALAFAGCSNNNDKARENTGMPGEEQRLTAEVKEFPDSSILVENLAQYYRENNRYNDAIAAVNAAISRDSLNARYWDIKATLQFENTDTLAAIHSFERSIDINPQPDVVISLGVIYAQTKNPMALAMADGLVMANSAGAEKEALFIKGLYYSYVNEKKKAIGFFDQCIKMSYTFMEAYREKAIALYDLGQYNDAIEVLNKAVTLQNNYDEGYYYLGRCLQKLNRNKEAIDMYQRALLYDPNYIEAKQALSELGVKS